MKHNSNHGFDEVLIVNPYDPTAFGQGETAMPYHYGNPAAMGYYGDGYGFYAQPTDPNWGDTDVYGAPQYGYGAYEPAGYYAAPEQYGYYAEPEHYGYYAQPGYGEPVGYYADPGYGNDLYGYYGQGTHAEPGVDGYYAEPAYGYAAEPDVYGYYGEPAYGYAAAPEMVGYGAEPSSIREGNITAIRISPAMSGILPRLLTPAAPCPRM